MCTRLNVVSLVAVLIAALSISLQIGGCAKEKEMDPVAVPEMVEYRDPGIRFQIKHPKDWVINAEVGRARFYNAPDVNQKFLDPASVGPLGVEIAIDILKTADPMGKIKQIKDEMKAVGIQLGQEQAITVAEREAVKVPYVANYGGKNIINGHHVLIASDSVVFDLGFAGFGDYYNAYAGIFDACLNSFVPPKPVAKGRDETLPSETFSEYSGKLFRFQYPDNFNFTNPPKGKFDEVLELRGVRLDCSVRFDVFGAKGLTVEKVFDQNKKAYKIRSTGKTTVAGENALFVNYPSRADVDSRAYFVVKNDKVFRVTMNWYKPQTESYVAAYEKVVSSIKFR